MFMSKKHMDYFLGDVKIIPSLTIKTSVWKLKLSHDKGNSYVFFWNFYLVLTVLVISSVLSKICIKKEEKDK